jgi:hypothetical protein
MAGIGASIGGALVMAAVSTLGDFIWANWITRHHMLFGLAHGTLLFLCMGLYLGAIAGKPAAGAIAGAFIGVTAAGSYYLLAPSVGYSVMFFVWIAVWAALAALHRWLQHERTAMHQAFIRGSAAALLSGLAFFAVSGIWRPFNPHGWDYAVHFLSWTAAFLPGFAALMVRRSASSIRSNTTVHPASQ